MLHWIDWNIINTPWFIFAVAALIFFTWGITTLLVYIAARED